MLGGLRLLAGRAESRTAQQLLAYGNGLLPHQNAQQPHQGHQRGRWRAHLEQTVDHADQESGAQR
ncbi:hypothetical protein D3C72_2480660 [compost metagenome]